MVGGESVLFIPTQNGEFLFPQELCQLHGILGQIVCINAAHTDILRVVGYKAVFAGDEKVQAMLENAQVPNGWEISALRNWTE